MKKNSFKLFHDSLDVLDDLTDEQAGQLLKAIVLFEAKGEESLTGLMKAIFVPFKHYLSRNKTAYAEQCEINRLNGLKGGRPKTETKRMGLLETEPNRTITEPNPEKGDKDKDKDKEKTKDLNESKTIRPTYSQEFESFWNEYPNKKGKHKAYESWKRFKCGNGLFTEIMSSLKKQKNSDEWARDGGKYIPHGSTWVNGKMWEDTFDDFMDSGTLSIAAKVRIKKEAADRRKRTAALNESRRKQHESTIKA